MRECIWSCDHRVRRPGLEPGPIRRAASAKALALETAQNNDGRGVWVPAFAGTTMMRSPVSRIGNHAAGDQPVPDEQYQQRADGGGDEAGALVGAVMADRLADEGGQKR